MLKVVVYDSGYGGEFFADKLAEELPVLEIIRVIDWRNAESILGNPRSARKLARIALRPYIGKVDLIIFANHLLSITSLKYFKRKYKKQKFIGLSLKIPDTFVKRDTLILTTKAITKTMNYYNYIFHLKRKSKTLIFDDWPAKIDEGTLTEQEMRDTLKKALKNTKLNPQEIILACSHFDDIKTNLKNIFGHNLKIHDSNDDTIHKVCQVLRIRGGVGKRKK